MITPAVPVVTPFDGVIALVAGLLIAGVAFHASARYLVLPERGGRLSIERGVVTALLGALVWAALEWIPLVGSLLAVAGWIGVIRWRYPGGWLRATILGVGAWAAAVVVLAALELIGLGSLSAVGIPGT